MWCPRHSWYYEPKIDPARGLSCRSQAGRQRPQPRAGQADIRRIVPAQLSAEALVVMVADLRSKLTAAAEEMTQKQGKLLCACGHMQQHPS